jgi:signal transduction histidine kinase
MNNSNQTTQTSQQDLQKQLSKIIQRNQIEKTAIKTLSQDLTKKLDLGEAIDTVNKYLWEILDYSVASYIIYNFAENRFESRVYLKESVSNKFLDQIRNQLIQYITNNSKDTIVGAVSSVRKMEPIFFGVKPDDQNPSDPLTGFVVPLKVGGEIIGAINISSSKSRIFTIEDQDFVDTLLTTASVSIARIQTLVQSLHSRTESLIQSLSNGVIMFGLDREVTLANPAAVSFTGLSKEGYNLEELYKLFIDIPLKESVEKAIIDKKTTAIPEAKVSQMYYEIFVVPVLDSSEEIISGSIILHDITQMKKIEELKTEFLSVAAHQLRTPLGSMRWNLEMILDGDLGEINEELKETVLQTYSSNRRLLTLVNDLLNVSRIDQERVADKPEPTNILETVQAVLKEQKPEITKKNITLQLDTPTIDNFPNVIIDGKRFYEVFSNLISNAIKYNKDSGLIYVETTYDKNFVYLTITDTGIGIPQADLKKLFSKFFRAENAVKSETSGTGLGLFVVKTYVESWGGSVDIKSTEGKGTTLSIRLPMQPSQHALDKNL